MERSSVYLVDDDAAVRNALKLYLEHEKFVVNAFSSAEALLESIDSGKSGVLVLDVRMDGMSGLELQARLKELNIDMAIIFITGHGTVRDSVLAMKEGAVDFIEKPFENDELLSSINQAFKRETRLNERRHLAFALSVKYQRLTPREQEVMKHVVEGKSNKQLAIQLGVSNRTIEVHRSRIMTKMGAKSLPDLVRMSLLLNTDDDYT